MKNRATLLFSIFLIFLLNHTILLAQDAPINNPAYLQKVKRQKTFTKIGLDLGLGSTQLNFKQLNQRLADLNIGHLDEELINFNFNLYTELYGKIGLSFDFGLGTSDGGMLKQPNSNLSFTTFSFGPSIYVPLFHTNRIFLYAMGGLRSVDMSMKYNAATNNAANFNLLLNNPGANSSSFQIKSDFNQNALFGGRFQFRIEKGYQEKSPDIRLGLDAGYAHCFEFTPWTQDGSNQPITNMPEVKPDNVYFNLNLSGYF